MRRLLPILLALSACEKFNDECRTEASELVGESYRSLDLRTLTLRTKEAPAGNLLADALLSEVVGADLALVPAGLFSRKTECGLRDFVDRGRLDRADIEAMLPTTDTVVLLSITSEDLKRVLEHAISQLGTSLPESENFLQVAGVLFTADCAEAAQTLTEDGKAILFPGARIQPASIFVKGAVAGPGQTFKLATMASLTVSEAGFVDLAQPGRLLVDTRKTPRDLLIDYLRKRSPVDPKQEARIALRESCGVR
jgi:2',3'-cyclic-nucleotide 2'-phosphodiesterase (5'-nucleotidase family)